MLATVALVVLSQVAVPLVPAEPPPPPPSSAPAPCAEEDDARGGVHWMITTPIMAAFLGAGVGVVAASSTSLSSSNAGATYGAGALVGAGIGAGLGLLAGYFAREGYVGGKVASISLWSLGGATIVVAAITAVAFVVVGAFVVGLSAAAQSQSSSFFPFPIS
jgi:hypothetical protein